MKGQGLNYFIWLCSILIYHGCISFLLHFLHGVEKLLLSLIFPISFGVINIFSNYSNSSLKCLLVNISDDQTESFWPYFFWMDFALQLFILYWLFSGSPVQYSDWNSTVFLVWILPLPDLMSFSCLDYSLVLLNNYISLFI